VQSNEPAKQQPRELTASKRFAFESSGGVGDGVLGELTLDTGLIAIHDCAPSVGEADVTLEIGDSAVLSEEVSLRAAPILAGESEPTPSSWHLVFISITRLRM